MSLYLPYIETIIYTTFPNYLIFNEIIRWLKQGRGLL